MYYFLTFFYAVKFIKYKSVRLDNTSASKRFRDRFVKYVA